jgi:peptidoglycan/xylan/chitin deacetylase (PgdA/CDA1 family)
MLWSIFLIALPAVHAAVIHPVQDHNDESHQITKRLPTTWYHSDDHPVHALFKRAPGDGTNYPAVGSPTWSAPFPRSSPDVSQLPKEWVTALNAAVAAGKIPNIPQSSNTPGVNPVYPQGVNPNGPEVCSATYKCRIPGDIWDAPDGYFALSFDDGPTPASPKLLQFLNANNEIATHFMIGVNILQNPQLFLDIFNAGNDIAVHTWTHPYMTTLSNLEIVAQLGWTSELIRNSTGGRVPKYWRPPFGDSDTRVRAIAKQVFGLETVIWNDDTSDWSLTTGGTTAQAIHNLFVQWLTGPKSPGVMPLEHEISDQSVQAFIDNYPMIKPNGWKTGSLTRLVGNSTYQNSKDSNSPVAFDGTLVGSVAPVQQNSSVPASQTSTSQSTRTETQVPPTLTTNGLQSSQTSNAASALVSRDASWNLPYVFLSLCAPVIMALLSVLA